MHVRSLTTSFLYNCSNQCQQHQVCFLGKCYCLPGWSGVECQRSVRFSKIDGALCPNFSNIEQVQNTVLWDFPQDKCHIPFNDPKSCAIHCFWQEDAGIVQVSVGTWMKVSLSEAIHHEIGAGKWGPDVFLLPESNTRFHEFSHAFDNYKQLPQNLGRFIEIGAGLYSQLINLMRCRPDTEISQIYFAEPNIFRYLSNPDCTYKNATLIGGHRVHLLSVLVEELPAYDFFDTLMVINVLEHVRNGFTFLTSIHKALKPGGILIFSERYFEDPDQASTAVLGPATLHPVRVKRNVLLHFFRLFDIILLKDFQTPESFRRNLNETGYHIIGRKKPVK